MLDRLSSNFSYLISGGLKGTGAAADKRTGNNYYQPSGYNYTLETEETTDSFVRGSTAQSQTQQEQQITQIPQATYYYGFGPKLLLRSYLNKSFIDNLAAKNPKVQEILDEYNVEYSPHPENVSNIVNSHLMTTLSSAMQIANNMGVSDADKQILEQAAIFHDFGKVLIPDEVLNKPARLTDSEREIMNLHSELGYELLSQTGMNKRVLNLVRNHHNSQEADDQLTDILAVADIYSALKEKRCYKRALTDEEAFGILDQMVSSGQLNGEVVESLKSVKYPQQLAA